MVKQIYAPTFHFPVIPLLFAFAAGILVCSALPAHPVGLYGAAGASLILIAAAAFSGRTIVAAPLILFFCLGGLSMAVFVPHAYPDHHLAAIARQTDRDTWWTISGTVDSRPEVFDRRQVVLLDVHHLSTADRQVDDPKGRLRVSIYGCESAIPFGASLTFAGRIRTIRNFQNPGGFDYAQYMGFRNVFGHAYTTAKRAVIEPPASPCGMRCRIEAARTAVAETIASSTPARPAGILKALVAGLKGDIAPSAREAFTRAGTAHLLAISGLHVGIVAGVAYFLFFRVLAFVPILLWSAWVRKGAAIGALVCVVGYGLIAGMSPSTQRAVIMVSVFLVAIVVERDPSLMNTLALAALVILIIDPPALFSVSFQLSFSAVFFIVYGMNAVRGAVAGLENRWMRKAAGFLLVSGFAIAGTQPLTMHYFNQAAMLGLLSNCMLIPLVGFAAVPMALFGAFVNIFSAAAAGWCFGISGIIVNAGLVLAEAIAALPFAAVRTVTPSWLEIVCYDVLLWAGLTLIGRRLGKGRDDRAMHSAAEPPMAPLPSAVPAVLMGAALVVLAADIGYWVHHRFFHDDLRITILDVGQGNAAVVEMPGGKCMVIDGGGFTGSTTFDVGERIVAPFLWRNKIATVDMIVLTHPDTDHVGGLAFIAGHFHVAEVWDTHQPKDTDEYQAFRDVLEQQQTACPEFIHLQRSRRIAGVRIDILYPPANAGTDGGPPLKTNPNNNSLVTRIAMGNVAFLFPGDIMAEAERELVAMAGDRLHSTVLIAPHHGSKTSSTPVFLRHVSPEVVVVSAGWENRYGYPHDPVLRRYRKIDADVYVTGQHGAVLLTTKGKQVSVKTPLICEDW